MFNFKVQLQISGSKLQFESQNSISVAKIKTKQKIRQTNLVTGALTELLVATKYLKKQLISI